MPFCIVFVIPLKCGNCIKRSTDIKWTPRDFSCAPLNTGSTVLFHGNRIIFKQWGRDFAVGTWKKCDNWRKTQLMQTQRKARNSDLKFRQLSWWKRIQSEYFGLRGQGTWFQAGEVFQDGRLGLRTIFETLNGGQFTLPTQLIIKKLPDRKFDPDRLFKWGREKDGKEKKAENGSHC